MPALPQFLAQSQQYLAGSYPGALPTLRGQRTESYGFAALLLFFSLTALIALAGA
jgi:hypothetical protein